MQLTAQEVKHVANLARLSLTDQEVDQYSRELSAILEYIEQLNEVNISGVQETSQVTGLVNVVRDDVVEETPEEQKKKLIEQFPNRLGKLLKVKGVFSNKEDDDFI